jgi:hypothetical protein
MTTEKRQEAFKNSLSGIHVTAASEPGYFDKYSDPIKKLGQLQVHARNIATDLLSRSGASPEQLKGVNSIVLHSKDALRPGTKAAYVKDDSSIHVNISSPKAAKAITHEIGHHVNGHRTPEELHSKGQKTRDILYNVGGSEAEADHFSDPNSAAKNLYSHAVTHHLNDSCTKSHGDYSHRMVKAVGKGYSDRMKSINPGIHKQLTGDK